MSDYEGEGWSNVQLSSKQGPVTVSSFAFSDSIVPNGHDHKAGSPGNVVGQAQEKRSLGPRPSKTFHPVLQNIRPRTYHGTGGRPVDNPYDSKSSYQEIQSYKLFLAKPDIPDDVYELDIPWKSMLRAIPETSEMKARDIARNNLDNISVFSDAFLKTPEADSPRIEIWGDIEQCAKAKARLQAWESHLRSTGTRPSQKIWIKERAFDGRKEDRKRQALWQELEDQALQDADDSEFEYEAYLVWPKEYDLEAYLNKYEPFTIREIGKEFACRFKHDRKGRPRYTRVQAQAEGNLVSAYQRLINLVKEMVAQKTRGSHGNFCRLPSVEAYRDEVVTQQVAEAPNAPYQPSLYGMEWEGDTDAWLHQMKMNEKQNRIELRGAMDSFIKTLYMSRCHLRLRVSFGDLLLRQFGKSKEGNLTFGFDEFLGVLQAKRTEFHDPVLQGSPGDIASIVTTLAAMKQLQYPEEGYRQIFEFKGTDVTNRLRLEIEMQPGYDFDEPQVCGQRWLTFKTYGQNENILGLKVLDFERPGYMIRADHYDLFTNDNIIKDMEAFRSSVSFKPSRDGVRAYPKLRSTFPGHSKLVSVTEFTSTKFRFKDTDGIVEFRREDVFMQDTGRPSKLPDKTRFEVLYYYPEWDNLLGELSNIQPGEDVSWRREFLTFFPNHIDSDRPRSLPKGFKAFLNEVHEIQNLLKDALTDLADRRTE